MKTNFGTHLTRKEMKKVIGGKTTSTYYDCSCNSNGNNVTCVQSTTDTSHKCFNEITNACGGGATCSSFVS